MDDDPQVLLPIVPRQRLWLFGALGVLAVLLAVDWSLPSYVPFPTVYVVFAGVAGWLGGLRCGLIVSAVILADLTLHESVHDRTGGWAVGWDLAARLVLYSVVLWMALWGRRTVRRLQVRATTDPLTGLFNRRYFADAVAEEFRRAWRYQRPACVAILDVNAFKAFNDTYGHVAGDEMLVKVASIMRAETRLTDTVCRLGGDEFAILFPETTAEDARIALDHLAQRVAEHYPAGVSAGVNAVEPTLDAVLNVGDREMYRVKQRVHREPEA